MFAYNYNRIFIYVKCFEVGEKGPYFCLFNDHIDHFQVLRYLCPALLETFIHVYAGTLPGVRKMFQKLSLAV